LNYTGKLDYIGNSGEWLHYERKRRQLQPPLLRWDIVPKVRRDLLVLCRSAHSDRQALCKASSGILI